jgi:hypothetical protein
MLMMLKDGKAAYRLTRKENIRVANNTYFSL